ncbi:DUF4129 domain-containing protein [Brevibacillus fluminis]|uniref:DUF4129 domain-containing protein n=1 Tax=Brevibacillus fluminis TaxID=511487 RepID=UPI003F8C8C78
MNDNAVLRSSLALTFEAQIIALLLFVTPYLAFSGKSAIGLFLTISVLFSAGSFFYQKSSRGFLGLILLSLTVLLVAVLGYVYADSVILALAGAAVYYWRLHVRAAEGITLPELTKRFTLVMFTYVCLMIWLALTGAFSLADLMLALSFSTVWFLIMCYLEFLTRDAGSAALSGGKIAVFASQQAGLAIGIIAVFLTAASLLYYALAYGFALIKGPVLSLLKVVFMPLLLWLDSLVAALKGKASNNTALNKFLEQGGGAQQEYAPPPPVQQDLFSRLEPYLIALVALLILFVLARMVWKHYKKNKRVDQPMQPITPPAQTVEKLSPSVIVEEKPHENLQKWHVPQNDRVRYAYYRFLQQMSERGMLIHLEETSREFLQRIRAAYANSPVTPLAERITRTYESYRYGGQQLAEDEIVRMEADVAEFATLARNENDGARH